jgi:histidinol-phosphate/aromatic aminotransferase/cobyric acid decarboxylase-like protein
LIRDRSSLINLNNCVRITIGNITQMNRVINIIKDYKNE